MKLLQLFIIFEKAQFAAGIHLIDDNHNRLFLTNIIATSIITSINDTCPIAVESTITTQANESKTNSLKNIARYYPDSILELFFKTKLNYYYNKKSLEVSIQAFLATLSIHISMSSELGRKQQALYAASFSTFIYLCKEQHQLGTSKEEFLVFFETQFEKYNIMDAIEGLFFSKIKGEKQFSQSLVEGLLFEENWLKEAGFLDENGHLISRSPDDNNTIKLIDADAPKVDSKNLQALKALFYELDGHYLYQLSTETIIEKGLHHPLGCFAWSVEHAHLSYISTNGTIISVTNSMDYQNLLTKNISSNDEPLSQIHLSSQSTGQLRIDNPNISAPNPTAARKKLALVLCLVVVRQAGRIFKEQPETAFKSAPSTPGDHQTLAIPGVSSLFSPVTIPKITLDSNELSPSSEHVTNGATINSTHTAQSDCFTK